MFSKLLRLSGIKSIVRIDIDQRIVAWAASVFKWELFMCMIVELILILQFYNTYGSLGRNIPQFVFLTCLLMTPLLSFLIDMVR